VATLVCFHAHPDDESIATGGVMARAAAAGHRVVLVVATRGEHGEVDDGFLDEGEALGARRERETLASAEVLGAARVAFLGYTDSGMMGTPTNDDPGCFWRADVEEAAGRLAAILTEEGADILTVYDDNGGYGHPDHIQVHRVGLRAARWRGRPRSTSRPSTGTTWPAWWPTPGRRVSTRSRGRPRGRRAPRGSASRRRRSPTPSTSRTGWR
jgi:LmbE family N-acetylglucosaminyl deacetylase